MHSPAEGVPREQNYKKECICLAFAGKKAENLWSEAGALNEMQWICVLNPDEEKLVEQAMKMQYIRLISTWDPMAQKGKA